MGAEKFLSNLTLHGIKIFKMNIPCKHEWKYDGSGGYGGNRYVCIKCRKTMWN